MFARRRQAETPAGNPAEPSVAYPWSSRIDAARRTVATQAPNSAAIRSIDNVADRLVEAEQDRIRLGTALAQLDPERTSRELKDALRAAKRAPGSVADARLDALRERYATVNRLQDRIDDLGQRIEAAVIDVELLGVRTVEATALGGGDDAAVERSLAEPLEQLRIDVEALTAAHDELRSL